MATVASAANADVSPVGEIVGGNAYLYTLCSNYTGTSACTAASGDQIVMDTSGFLSVNVDLDASSATFTCTVKGNDSGYDAGNGGVNVHAGSLNNSSPSVVITHPPRRIWVECTVNSGGTGVSATALGRLNK